jgi:hypothetical protein
MRLFVSAVKKPKENLKPDGADYRENGAKEQENKMFKNKSDLPPLLPSYKPFSS